MEDIEILENEQNKDESPTVKKSKPDEVDSAKDIIQTLRKHDVQQAQLKVVKAEEKLSTFQKENDQLKKLVEELKRTKRDDMPGGLNSVQDTILRAINFPKVNSSNDIEIQENVHTI